MRFVLLTVDDVIAVHDYVLSDHESQGLAGGKFLDGALGRVENRLNYGLIEDVFDLGASYAAAISQAHCFNDGNKRTAFQVMDVVLDLNGVQMAWETEVIGQKIVLVAQSKLDDVSFAEWLRQEASRNAVLSSE
jgi:death-on-curing protein